MSSTEKAKDTQSVGAVFQQSALQTQILLLLYDGWLVSDFSLFWDYQFSVVKRERKREKERDKAVWASNFTHRGNRSQVCGFTREGQLKPDRNLATAQCNTGPQTKSIMMKDRAQFTYLYFFSFISNKLLKLSERKLAQ